MGLCFGVYAQTPAHVFPGEQFSVGSNPQSAAVGDLNGDGRPDVVTANNASAGTISVLLADDSGGFETATQYPVGSFPQSVAIGNLDGANGLDVVVANTGSNTVSVLLSDGLGGFGGATSFPVGANPRSVAIGKLNGTGGLDLVTANSGSNNVSVLLGNGQGGFGSATHFAVGAFPRGVAIGNLDGASGLDLATADLSSNTVSVLIGNNQGVFSSLAQYPMGSSPTSVALGDLNRDGRPDLVAANGGLSSNVWVRLSDGLGGFLGATSFSVAGPSNAVLVADLNRDNRADIVLPDSCCNTVSVLHGNGQGLFDGAIGYQIGIAPYTLAIADLNDDGRQDLLTTNGTTLGRVSVIHGERGGGFATQVRLRDDGSGEPLSHEGQATADLNGDGAPDFAWANSGVAGSVSVLLSDGEGGFDPATHYFCGPSGNSYPSAVALRDVIDTPAPDLIVTNFDANGGVDDEGVSVLPGKSQGTFGPSTFYSVICNPSYLTIDNVDADEFLDIVLAKTNTNPVTMRVLRGTGQGFGALVESSIGSNYYPAAFGHFNGDGKLDLIATNVPSDNVSVFLGTGQGGFSSIPSSSFDLGEAPYSFATAGDFNGDGAVDVAVPHGFPQVLSVILGDGQGGLTAAIDTPVDSGMTSLANRARDLDGDGRADVLGGTSSGNTTLLLGNGVGGFGTAQEFGVGGGPVLKVEVNDVECDDEVVAKICEGDGKTCHNQLGIMRRKRPTGRVILGRDSVPMKCVAIMAIDSVTGIVVAQTYTARDGSYVLKGPQLNGLYYIRASLTHHAPDVGGNVTIANYPLDDPGKTWPFVGGQPTRAIPPIRFPDPLVLQPGFLGDASTWAAALPFLRADPADPAFPDKNNHKIPAFMCRRVDNYNNSGRSVDNFQPNAQLLFDTTAELRTSIDTFYINESDKSRVWVSVLAHSMGGPIVRSLVTGFAIHQGVIFRIISLDATHGGTDRARLLSRVVRLGALYEQDLNGWREFPSTGNCEPIVIPGWNADHIEQPGREREWLLYMCEEPFLDIVRPDESAWGLGRPWVRSAAPQGPDTNLACRIDCVLTETEVTVTNGHMAIHNSATRFREWGEYLARGTLPPPNAPNVVGPPPDPTEGLGYCSSSLTANAGSVTTRQETFDTNSTVYGIVLRSGASAQYSVRGPGGVPLPLVNFQSNPLSDDHYLEQFELANPPAGTITMRLAAGSAPAEVAYAFLFDNGRRLVTTTSTLVLNAGSPINVIGRIVDGNGSTISTGTVPFAGTVYLPNDTTQAVPMFDDGSHGDGAASDGVFGGTYTATSQQGRYGVLVDGHRTSGADNVVRAESANFIVAATGGSFVGAMTESTVDANGNGLKDSLTFSQQVSFTEVGTFMVKGDLVDVQGDVISTLRWHYTNTQGGSSQVAALTIAGEDLTVHGEPGPWTLSNITMSREDLGSLVVATRPNYQSQAYALAQFEWPPPPTIGTITPNEGVQGDKVTITGTGFTGTTTVRVGTRSAIFTVLDDGAIQVTMPASSALPRPPQLTGSAGPVTFPNVPGSGPVDIIVITPWGYDSVPNGFVYQ